MFEDSLIESGGKLKTNRGWTSIVSFALEFMIIGVMVLIPLIFTEALPKTQLMTFLVAPPPPPPPPPPAAAVHVVKQVQTDIVNGELRTPTKIPKKIRNLKEDEASATNGCHWRSGRRPWRRTGWIDGRRDGQRAELHSCRGAEDRYSAAHSRFFRREHGSADPQDAAGLIRPWRARRAFRAS